MTTTQMQALTLVAPQTFDDFPVGHCWHWDQPVSAEALEYRPAGQGKHSSDPLLLYVPGGQSLQAVLPIPDVVPAAQAEHFC